MLVLFILFLVFEQTLNKFNRVINFYAEPVLVILI